MNNSQAPVVERTLINQAIRMEIFLYIWIFICYTAIFYAIASIIHIKNFMGVGTLLCIYIVTSLMLLSILYHKAIMRYRAYYVTLSWNQRISPEEVANVLQRRHSLNESEMLEFENENDTPSICFCMEEKENAEYVKLDCNHIFHTACLAQWLIHNNTCPNCRVGNIINPSDFPN